MDKTNVIVSLAAGLITALVFAHTAYNPIALFIAGAGISYVCIKAFE